MLEVSLGRLYRAIATWRPSDTRIAATCRSCIGSPFREAAPLAPLPESVVHGFLLEMEVVVHRRLGELRDERDAWAAACGWDGLPDEGPADLAELVGRAEHEVCELLFAHRADIDRLRLLHLEPRLADWIDREAIPLSLDPRPEWLP
jgi:hypothetical protein